MADDDRGGTKGQQIQQTQQISEEYAREEFVIPDSTRYAACSLYDSEWTMCHYETGRPVLAVVGFEELDLSMGTIKGRVYIRGSPPLSDLTPESGRLHYRRSDRRY
jgi:hypothetical protein